MMQCRCEQVVALSDAVLLARFGERARFIAASVRGISDEPVQVSSLVHHPRAQDRRLCLAILIPPGLGAP